MTIILLVFCLFKLTFKGMQLISKLKSFVTEIEWLKFIKLNVY